jgi:hypothetical protein
MQAHQFFHLPNLTGTKPLPCKHLGDHARTHKLMMSERHVPIRSDESGGGLTNVVQQGGSTQNNIHSMGLHADSVSEYLDGMVEHVLVQPLCVAHPEVSQVRADTVDGASLYLA